MLFNSIRVQSRQDGIGHCYWDQYTVSTTGDSKDVISSYCKGKGLIALGAQCGLTLLYC